jgi:putative toxin-antitoxin system antitoxin component (TIGR02293 family)
MAGSAPRREATLESVLGGLRVIYPRRATPGRLETAVREGLPFRSFESVAGALGVVATELAGILGVAQRTLTRRKQDRALSALESDRLVAVARVASLAREILGAPDRVHGWLKAENAALGGATPLSCLDTEPGRRRVEAVLQQIRYGMIG